MFITLAPECNNSLWTFQSLGKSTFCTQPGSNSKTGAPYPGQGMLVERERLSTIDLHALTDFAQLLWFQNSIIFLFCL